MYPPRGRGYPQPQGRGMPYPQRGGMFPHRGMPPPHRGMPPPHRGMPPPRRVMPPPQRGMPPQRAMYHGGYPQHAPYPGSNYPTQQNIYYDGGYGEDGWNYHSEQDFDGYGYNAEYDQGEQTRPVDDGYKGALQGCPPQGVSPAQPPKPAQPVGRGAMLYNALNNADDEAPSPPAVNGAEQAPSPGRGMMSRGVSRGGANRGGYNRPAPHTGYHQDYYHDPYYGYGNQCDQYYQQPPPSARPLMDLPYGRGGFARGGRGRGGEYSPRGK